MKTIYTSSYDKCKAGNMISISGDKGKSVNFHGKSIIELAPKKEFWNIWHDNIGRLSEKENSKYYIREYYKQVLSKVDILALLENEIKPILLCYEDNSKFCHRHILAEYLYIKHDIFVPEISIDEKGIVRQETRPKFIKEILKEIIDEESH